MPRKKPPVAEYEYYMCSDGLERPMSPFVPLPDFALPPRLRKPIAVAEGKPPRRKREAEERRAS